MSQSSCSMCGTPFTAGQRFCSSCGATLNAEFNSPTELTPSGPQFYEMSTQRSVPPPPPDAFPQGQGPSYTAYPQQGASYPLSSHEQGYQQTPAFATPQKDSSAGVLRQISCGVLAVILLILAACGTATYFVVQYVNHTAHNVSRSIQSGSSSYTGSTATNVTPTLGPTITTPINATVTYADVRITIVDAKQAQSFADDADSPPSGVLRLDIKEQNTTTRSGNYLYSDVARLLLPNGTSVAPVNAQESIGPGAAVSRTNWLDFPVSTNTQVSQLMLTLGKNTEAQISISLTGKADLSKYQAKTVNPNKSGQYAGLNWTITTATSSLSAFGQQAARGMQYVTITLKVDNPSSHGFSAYWGDYMRLKAGATTSSPAGDTSFPTDVPSGSAGTTGSVTFLVPQNVNAYTFILLGNSASQVSQTTMDFQIS